MVTGSAAGVPNRQIAMLIDGDNAQASLIDSMLSEAGKYGVVTIRRIYGDWTMENMKSWKEALHVNAIQPIQQFRYTTGKNATDSAMIIDAMDILYSSAVSGFCLVSSDSDYTRLATRVREKGLFVMGIGKRTTPRAFITACEIFVYTENLSTEAEPPKPRVTRQRRLKRAPEPAAPAPVPAPVPLLRKAFEMAVQDDGWASLATVGNRLRQLDSGFDPRTYGSKQLSGLIRAYSSLFESKDVQTEDGPALIYVRLKDSHPDAPAPVAPAQASPAPVAPIQPVASAEASPATVAPVQAPLAPVLLIPTPPPPPAPRWPAMPPSSLRDDVAVPGSASAPDPEPASSAPEPAPPAADDM